MRHTGWYINKMNLINLLDVSQKLNISYVNGQVQNTSTATTISKPTECLELVFLSVYLITGLLLEDKKSTVSRKPKIY